MTFEELEQYLQQPKAKEPHSFVENAIRQDHHMIISGERVQVSTREVLQIHQGASSSLRVIPHFRYAAVAPHDHDFFELMYVYRGTIGQNIEGQKLTLEETDAVLLAPGVSHSIEAAGTGDLAVSVIIPKEYLTPERLGRFSRLGRLSGFLNGSGESSARRFILWRGNGREHLKNCANIFLCEAFDLDRYSGQALDSGLHLLLTELERGLPVEMEPRLMNIHADISRILEYIEKNYATASLKELSERFGYSQNYLSRAIKAQLGISFKDYQHQLCMQQSGFLLCTTPYSVRQIANEVGLSNMSFFYKLFQGQFGMSPAEYRLKFAGDDGKC